MALPSIICIKSTYNSKYLRYRSEDVQSHGLVQFAGDKATDPLAQFQVVTSTNDVGLVHLKSRYSNKFLVRWSPVRYLISASADATNEDQTSWGCTLFKPSFIDGSSTNVRLVHAQSSRYLSLARVGVPFDSCLFAGTTGIDPNSADIFTIIDWLSILKLPKNVAFKGVESGKYLGAFLSNGIPYLQFSFDDPNNPKVAHEVVSSPDGTVMIKSKYYGKYWRLGAEDWIVADVVDPASTDDSAMFRVNAIDVDVVALLNMNKTWYCKRYTQSDAQESLLKSAIQSVDSWSVLEVKDLGK